MTNRILFLCTGNYYRSRFAQDWFNHLARQQGLGWSAESRGLAEDNLLQRNIGPMSVHAIQELQRRGARPSIERWPQSLKPGEAQNYQMVIALNRPEHQPLFERRFSEPVHVTYWDIKDLGEESSESALARLAAKVEALVGWLALQDKMNDKTLHSSPMDG